MGGSTTRSWTLPRRPHEGGRLLEAAKAKLLIYGAGGHGRVVLDAARASGCFRGWAFVDEGETLAGKRVDGVAVCATPDEVLCEEGPWQAVIALGDPRLRLEAVQRISQMEIRFATVIHPFAWVSQAARIAKGTVVFAGAVIQPGAYIGRHAIINTSASVDHDCRIGDFSHISPGAHLAGAVTVGRLVHVGMGASVIPGVGIGDEAVVGAGAVVVQDVSAGVTVVGVPAAIIPASDNRS